MVHVLLLTRGGLAAEWLRATTAVCGREPEAMTAVTLDYDGDHEADRAHVQRILDKLRDSGAVLVLTDLHGSTPTNLACDRTRGDVAVVAGANLAMVLRLACGPDLDRPVAELAEWICGKGREAIRVVSGTDPAT